MKKGVKKVKQNTGNVGFVILNWNQVEQTMQTVRSIKQFEGDIRIILVDNGSTRENVKLLVEFAEANGWSIVTQRDSDAKVVKDWPLASDILLLLSKNWGYAKGNNEGIRFLLKHGYRFSVVCNNDILMEEPVIERLLKFFEDIPELAVVGPKIIGPTGTPQGPFKKPGMYEYFWLPLFYPLLYLPVKILRRFRKTPNSKDNLQFTYRLMGCFMVVDNNKLKEVDYFDEKTFLYAEEPILAEKLIKKGYKTAYCNDVHVRHLHGSSTKTFTDFKRFQLNLLSDLYYFSKYRNFSKIRLFLITFARYVHFFCWAPVIRLKKRLDKQTALLK